MKNVVIRAAEAAPRGNSLVALVNKPGESGVLNETAFRSIVENGSGSIVVLNAKGTPTYAAPSINKILGYTEEEAGRLNLFCLTHPDDRPALEKLWDKVLANPSVPIRAYPCRVLHRDGNYRVLDGTLTNLLHDPSIAGIVDNFRDVTEMVEAEARLKESEERYRYLFLNNPMPMWIFDVETFRIMEVNEAAAMQYGYTIEEFRQLTVLDLRAVKDRQHFIDSFSSRKEGAPRKVGEFQHLTKNGETKYVDIVSNLIVYQNRKAMLVMAKDITEQKQANQLLFKSNKENHQILESISDGFFSMDENFRVIYWNKAAEDIMGVSRCKVLGKVLWDVFDTAAALKFFPEYRRAMRDQVQVMFEEYNPEICMWVEVSAYPAATGLSVHFRNITEKKLAYEKIRKANEQYNMLARITNDAIYEWDIVKNVIYWGEGFQTLFGHAWHQGPMPVESWRDNMHPNDKADLMNITQEAFAAKTSTLTREMKFRCADNTYKIVYDKLLIIYDAEGKPLRLMGAMQDMTEKRTLESKIQKARSSQQRAVTRATIQGQEKEREQIGIELHDNINQILATANLYIEHALSMPEVNTDLIAQSKDLVQMANKEIRKLSHALLPPALGDFELVPALKDLANSLNLSDTLLVDVHFRTFSECGLPREQKLTIYRIAQEQLNNILKHAQCTEVMISLRKQYNPEETTELIIEDNGKGFHAQQKKTGIGFRNIASRVEVFCGTVDIVSSPGNGCKLTVKIPMCNSAGL